MRKLWKVLKFGFILTATLIASVLIFVVTYIAFVFYLCKEVWRSLDYKVETQTPSNIGESCAEALREQAEKECAGAVVYN